MKARFAIGRSLAILPFCFLLGGGVSLAGSINWDGDNGVGNMSYWDNWFGNSNPDSFSGWVAGNDLYFNFRNGGASSIYFDYSSWRNIGNISFESTFNAATTWDGNGNGLNFNQKIENRMASTVTIGTMNFSGAKHGATTIELNPIGGNLVFSSSSSIYNDNSRPYVVNGSNGKTLTLNTALGVGSTASAVSFTLAQNSIVEIGVAQTYGGGTTVSAGKLLVNNATGSGTGAGSVSVASGATLGGMGIISGATTLANGGTHAAGNNGIGKQTFGSDLSYAGSSSIFSWELGSETTSGRGTLFDAVDVAGALSVSNSVFKIIVGGLDIAGTFWDAPTLTWDVFNKGSTGTFGTFHLFAASDLENPVSYTSQGAFSFDITTGDLKWTAVPEPSGVVAGVLLAAGMLRRKRG